jgi:hypothetical protein
MTLLPVQIAASIDDIKTDLGNAETEFSTSIEAQSIGANTEWLEGNIKWNLRKAFIKLLTLIEAVGLQSLPQRFIEKQSRSARRRL